MKKLSKLNINHERLIKNEDLQELRGGWLGQCVLLEDGAYYDTIQWNVGMQKSGCGHAASYWGVWLLFDGSIAAVTG